MPIVTKKEGGKVLNKILNYGFVLSLIVILLGFGLKYQNRDVTDNIDSVQNDVNNKTAYGIKFFEEAIKKTNDSGKKREMEQFFQRYQFLSQQVNQSLANEDIEHFYQYNTNLLEHLFSEKAKDLFPDLQPRDIAHDENPLNPQQSVKGCNEALGICAA